MENHTIVVNKKPFKFDDPKPTVAQILSKAGYKPADEHILIQSTGCTSNALGLNELVDLSTREGSKFWAFKSDRIFRLTIDGQGFEWGQGSINEPELRELAEIENDKVLVLERRDKPDHDLKQDDLITLTDAGTEHIRTVEKPITVIVDGIEKQIDRGSYTTEQLIDIFGIKAGYLLNVLDTDGQLKTLNPGEHIRVREEMKFISQVPSGGSS